MDRNTVDALLILAKYVIDYAAEEDGWFVVNNLQQVHKHYDDYDSLLKLGWRENEDGSWKIKIT